MAPRSTTVPRPIFIVGLPRTGTTLLEQILDSHSAVEGLGELSYVERLARELGPGDDPFVRLGELSAPQLQELGERYVQLASVHRTTNKPFFVDKMPSNWQYLPFIRAILPGAPIIDARRHPMDCCFANFRQHYPFGHEFTYSFDDLARYYHSYRAVMERDAASAPAQVHEFFFERLLTAPEAEITRLLTFLGLRLEAACLSPHENRRSVATPSAEQVRQPIASSFSQQWRPYERWLGPLRDALGAAIGDYPGD